MKFRLGTRLMLDAGGECHERSAFHFLRLLKLISGVKCPFAVET